MTENINKSTSRKNEGAAENNRKEIQDICSRAGNYKTRNEFVIIDRAENGIYVDTKAGLTAAIRIVTDLDGNRKVVYDWYKNGDCSCKSNGYVYTKIVMQDTYDRCIPMMIGTHTIVCMLAYKKEYLELSSNGAALIANHMNNCSWDNRAENLEWATQGENIRHGKIVGSLRHWFRESYTHTEYNESEKAFTVLDNRLSVRDIERYLVEINNKYEFKCANDEYINEDVMSAFVDWLIEKGIWQGSSIIK